MGFPLFLLVNALLFVRPMELMPELAGLPLYNYSILLCLVVAFPEILKLLDSRSLSTDPITVCVLGVQVAVVLSHISHFNIYDARFRGLDFLKLVLYYLLLVSLTTNLARLRALLLALIAYTAVMTTMALLDFHGAIDVPNLEPLVRRNFDERGNVASSFLQLCGSGIFNDPNDLCFFLSMACVLTLYFWTDRRLPWFRLVGLGLFGLFGYAISLTQSRGGLLAMLAGILVFLVSRFGGRRAIVLVGIALPLAFAVFAGRQTAISTSDGTAQSRLQLWSMGFQIFRTAPIFGIGNYMYAEEAGQVAHNSYVHAFVELGFFGGTCFLGAFYIPLRMLHGLTRVEAALPDPELRRLRHYLLAALAAYMMGMMTLSRCYTVPTYMIVGTMAAFLRLPAVFPLVPDQRLSWRLTRHLVVVSFLVLVALYLFTRAFVRWG